MENGNVNIMIPVPTKEFTEELKEKKGVDINDVLARLVYDFLDNVKKDNPTEIIQISVTVKQLAELDVYNINAPAMITSAFKKELEALLDSCEKTDKNIHQPNGQVRFDKL